MITSSVPELSGSSAASAAGVMNSMDHFADNQNPMTNVSSQNMSNNNMNGEGMEPNAEGLIFNPRDTDVLCGRGGAALRHPGNQTYRRLVNLNKGLYITCLKTEKLKISRSIVAAIRDQNGRFLEKDAKSNAWYDIGDKKAVEKTSQALREGQPKLRQKIAELGAMNPYDGEGSGGGGGGGNGEFEAKFQNLNQFGMQQQPQPQQQDARVSTNQHMQNQTQQSFHQFLQQKSLEQIHNHSDSQSNLTTGSNHLQRQHDGLQANSQHSNASQDLHADLLHRLSIQDLGSPTALSFGSGTNLIDPFQQQRRLSQTTPNFPDNQQPQMLQLLQQQQLQLQQNQMLPGLMAQANLAQELGITESQLSLMSEISGFGGSMCMSGANSIIGGNVNGSGNLLAGSNNTLMTSNPNFVVNSSNPSFVVNSSNPSMMLSSNPQQMGNTSNPHFGNTSNFHFVNPHMANTNNPSNQLLTNPSYPTMANSNYPVVENSGYPNTTSTNNHPRNIANHPQMTDSSRQQNGNPSQQMINPSPSQLVLNSRNPQMISSTTGSGSSYVANMNMPPPANVDLRYADNLGKSTGTISTNTLKSNESSGIATSTNDIKSILSTDSSFRNKLMGLPLGSVQSQVSDLTSHNKSLAPNGPTIQNVAGLDASNGNCIDRRQVFAKMKYTRPPSVSAGTASPMGSNSGTITGEAAVVIRRQTGTQGPASHYPNEGGADFCMQDSATSLYSNFSQSASLDSTTPISLAAATVPTITPATSAALGGTSGNVDTSGVNHFNPHEAAKTNLDVQNHVPHTGNARVYVETGKLVDHSSSNRKDTNMFSDAMSTGSRNSMMSGLSKISDASIDNSLFSDLSKKIGNVSTRSMAMSEMSGFELQELDEEDENEKSDNDNSGPIVTFDI